MAGDAKIKFAASVALTVTALHNLAASSTGVAGWSSASVDNTTDNYLDYLYSGSFVAHATGQQAGYLDVFVVCPIDFSTTWPVTSSGAFGTEGAVTLPATYAKRCVGRLIASVQADGSASATLNLPPTGIAQLFGGFVPPVHCLFIRSNWSSGTALAASGSAVYRTPVYKQML